MQPAALGTLKIFYRIEICWLIQVLIHLGTDSPVVTKGCQLGDVPIVKDIIGTQL